jgi:hypothetical protein
MKIYYTEAGAPSFDSDRGYLRHPNPKIRELIARETAQGKRT